MDLLLPNIAYASLDSFIFKVDALIVNPLIKLLFALATVYFLYGVFEFLANQNNEEKKTSGKTHMLYGIIGLTIMIGVFAIMNILLRTLAIDDEIDPKTGRVELNPYTPPPNP